MKSIITRTIKFALLCQLLFCLSALQPAATASESNISNTSKYAWSENAGWMNFHPLYGGVNVYDDHLEGYAWAENIGWIKLGSHTEGGTHVYNNTTMDWGVNSDGSGNLSGYAWSEMAGWIRFDHRDGQVTIDPDTGSFDGYAWSENVGWIHFKNSDPAYNVARKDILLSLIADPGEFSEAAGSEASTVTVTRIGSTDTALAVTLDSDNAKVSVPDIVVIPAGRASADFTIDAADDDIFEGTHIVTLTASASGFADGTVTVSVTDDDDQGTVVIPMQYAFEGSTVTLDGSEFPVPGPDDVIIWRQTDGTEVTLSDSAVINPTFTAPDLGSDGDPTLIFELTIKDIGGPEDKYRVAVIIERTEKYHSADYNPHDYRISLSELLRVIQLYTRNGYHCDPGGEDGYDAGYGDQSCQPHDSDYNPQDWKITLSELLRTVQLYNSSEYRLDSNGEDGFAPEE